MMSAGTAMPTASHKRSIRQSGDSGVAERKHFLIVAPAVQLAQTSTLMQHSYNVMQKRHAELDDLCVATTGELGSPSAPIRRSVRLDSEEDAETAERQGCRDIRTPR
jgi:hypothetical protein